MDIYREKQKFSQFWIWGLLLFLFVIIVYGGSQGFTEWLSLPHIIGLIIYILVLLFIYSFTLDIEISERGIKYSFFPLVQEKFLSWEEIEKIELIKYNSIKDFGGWGVRYNLKKNIEAYNTGGNVGILINDKLLLGIRKINNFKLFLSKNNNVRSQFGRIE